MKDDKLGIFSENMKILKTKSSADSVFEQKTIELFKHAILNDDSDADIKIYIILKRRW